MQKVDLSICMLTWNGRALTLACLQSLIENTRAITYEIVLVDNGSTDGTIDEVRARFPQVKLIVNASNQSFPCASNQALRVAQGRYAILLNNDMLFESDALSQMVAFMDGHSDIGVLGCRLRYPNGAVQHSAHADIKWWDHLFASFFLHRIFPHSRLFGRINCTYLDYDDNNLVVDVGFVVGAALMVRANDLEKVGLLDEQIFISSDDWEWCRRFAAHGYRIVYYTGAEIVHYHGMGTYRYEGNDRDAIRELSMLRILTSARYVYHKLHMREPIALLLFSFSHRLFSFSRVLTCGLQNLIFPNKADWGTFRGYWHGAWFPYNVMAQRYLRNQQ